MVISLEKSNHKAKNNLGVRQILQVLKFYKNKMTGRISERYGEAVRSISLVGVRDMPRVEGCNDVWLWLDRLVYIYSKSFDDLKKKKFWWFFVIKK